MKKLIQRLFRKRNPQLDKPVVISNYNHFDDDHNNWCKVFEDMLESPYIDVSSVRDCDRIAILSWLSSNYKSPVKRDKTNY